MQLIEVFLTPRFLAIVLEYAPGGDLLEYVTTKEQLSGGVRRADGVGWRELLRAFWRAVALHSATSRRASWAGALACRRAVLPAGAAPAILHVPRILLPPPGPQPVSSLPSAPLTAPCRPSAPAAPPARPAAEDEARWFFQQLTVGLAYLHSIGVDNRELNLNNKLLTGDKTRPLLKINDFTYRRAARLVPGGVWCLYCAGAGAGLSGCRDCAQQLARRAHHVLPAAAGRTAAGCAHARHPTPAARCSLACLRGLRPRPPCAPPACSKSEQINSDPNSALGSLPYTAPEVLSNTMRHGHQADVWSLGVALYKMCVGRYPFERPEDAADARTAVQVRTWGGQLGWAAPRLASAAAAGGRACDGRALLVAARLAGHGCSLTRLQGGAGTPTRRAVCKPRPACPPPPLCCVCPPPWAERAEPHRTRGVHHPRHHVSRAARPAWVSACWPVLRFHQGGGVLTSSRGLPGRCMAPACI